MAILSVLWGPWGTTYAQETEQGEPTPENPLHPLAYFVGGTWKSAEKITFQGRVFYSLRTYTWAMNDKAIILEAYNLYDDGTVEPNLTGLSVWNPVTKEVANYAIFSHGGLIEGAYSAFDDTLQVMDFTFYSAQTGTESSWRANERILDANTFVEEAYVWLQDEWKENMVITFARTDTPGPQ